MADLYGIIGAMESEVTLLIEAMQDAQKETHAHMTFYRGMLGAKEAVVVRSGVGKVNAAVCVQVLADLYHVTHIINTGVAGSLNAEINIGDVVLSTDAVQHDMDAVGFGYAKGEIPQLDMTFFPADKKLREALQKAVKEAAPDIGCFEGRIASGDQFIADDAVKQRIIREFQALCCEMEGASIAQAAFLNGIPFCIVRAISDKADGSGSVDYPTFEKKAAHDCATIVKHMLEGKKKKEA
ncbi:MAG: 5'-methylthioadenosine/adenosylhomocysteine nucleosidase [Lachnospiraceae bacterium]|nr:5'-methylthioadenosine/adenosylhomocysteine nucleosidase [Lachnospiraceae bacterium]